MRKYLDFTKTVNSNSLIDKTHKRALRVVHQNFNLSLEELFVNWNVVSIHIQNLRATDTVTLLGITFDSKLNFEKHIQNICICLSTLTKTKMAHATT